MFRIKICGVTSAVDARSAAEAGADAIGLNFYSGSRRYISPQAAPAVADAIPPGVLKVGVFVNADPEFIHRVADALRLDLIQLAGDETPEFVAKIAGRPVMQAFRPQLEEDGELAAIASYLSAAERHRCTPRMALVDAHCLGQFGGTGATVNWPLLSQSWNGLRGTVPPLVLAGGLKPENVAEAIRAVRPAAVDVANGVEHSPGIKDRARLHAFVAAAREAFTAMSQQQTQQS